MENDWDDDDLMDESYDDEDDGNDNNLDEEYNGNDNIDNGDEDMGDDEQSTLKFTFNLPDHGD